MSYSQFSLFNGGIVGESSATRALLRQIGVAARCDFTVLVSGESGTGKELVARAIHQQSARAMKPFVSVNCGALTETLLRVLQEGAFRSVGARVETSVDTRIIAATNRNLAHEMTTGRFRKDLYYRIAVLTIEPPPLRKRPSDIPMLVHHFMREAEEKIKCPRKHTI